MDDATKEKVREALNAVLTMNYGQAIEILEPLVFTDDDEES